MDPTQDGIQHINVYSQGKTSLGRFLSNFAYCEELKTKDGDFCSIEGYWYWLGCLPAIDPQCSECDGAGITVIGTSSYTDFIPCTVCSRERLRNLYGVSAKKFGRELRKLQNLPPDESSEDPSFQEKIKDAIRYKIEHSEYLEEFKKSTLPFEHYYVNFGRVHQPKAHRWVIQFLETLRQSFTNLL